jgi:hypothetical protein
MTWVAGDRVVDLSGHVALEAPDGLAAALSLRDAPVQVGAGALVPAQAGQHDGVQGAVGLAVAAAVEAVTLGLA